MVHSATRNAPYIHPSYDSILELWRTLPNVVSVALRQSSTDTYIRQYQLPLILTALLHVDLINVAYLLGCALTCNRSSWRCTLCITSSMTLNRHDNRKLHHTH